MMIAGLLAGLIGPRLTGSLGRTQIRTAAKNIAASLRYARSLAVSENAVYAGRFELEENRVIIGRIEAAAAEEGGGEIFIKPKTYRLPEGVRMEIPRTENFESAFDIRFYPAGNAGGGQIRLIDSQNRRQILTVDFITGTVTVAGEG